MHTQVFSVKIFSTVACAALISALMAGCSQNQSSSALSVVKNHPASPVDIVQMISGSNAKLTEPMVKLIHSDAQLKALGVSQEDVHLHADFSKEDVVVLALGKRPTGGYWAKITAVQKVGNNTLFAQGIVNRPSSDQAVTQGVTYPYFLAVIPKTGATHIIGDIQSVTGQQE